MSMVEPVSRALSGAITRLVPLPRGYPTGQWGFSPTRHRRAFDRQSKVGTVDVVSKYDAGRMVESPNEANGSDLRYRLDVLAPSVLDAVQSVGGWLFDHAMAGWEVTVLLIDQEDRRPLRILGVDVLGPVVGLEPWTRRAPAQILALAGDLLDRDDVRLGQSVSSALRRGLTQVAVWGDHPSLEWDRSLYEVRYELSCAARAFKAHALAAAAGLEPLSGDRVEIFAYSSAGCSPAGLRQRRWGLRALCE